MINRLNLASNPFRNRALPWTITTIVTVVSVALLLLIARSTIQTNAQTLSTQRQVTELQNQANALNKRAEEIKAGLTPDQLRTLKSAHSLVDRRRFSWSRLFADLESALPGTVKVSRIAVKQVSVQDDRPIANLDLAVICKNPATITQMIQDMEEEGVFHAELVSQTLQRGKGEGGTQYEMNVRYTPAAGAPIQQKSKRQVDTATEGSSAR